MRVPTRPVRAAARGLPLLVRAAARGLWRLVPVAALVMAGACATPPEMAGDPDLTGPLTALPPCDDPPEPDPGTGDPTPGMAMPPDVMLLSQSDQGPMSHALGYVELTPIQVRLDYEGREDLEIMHSEDEVFESELLVSDGVHRTFVRATAICDRGSHVLMVVAPETDAEGLPEPRYGEGPPAPPPSP